MNSQLRRYIKMQSKYNTVATLLSGKFRSLKTLTIYYSTSSLDNDQYQDMICASLIKMPKLKLFTIVVSDIKSDASFKPLGNRFNVLVDKEWFKNEKW